MDYLPIIFDDKIKALDVLLQMNIGDYLGLAQKIIDKNEYQRKRVKDSKTIYSLLREDLKRGCTIPPIVLAYRTEENIMKSAEKDWVSYSKKILESKDMIILDGLQRTFSMLDVVSELKDDKEALERFHKQQIRVEIYVGIDKLGILYRMLTLNTGQTKMSLRHQIEILYSDLKEKAVDGITFYSQKDGKPTTSTHEYQFKDAIDCLCSYIDRDPNGIEKSDIMESVTDLEKFSADNQKGDILNQLIRSYTRFMDKMNELTDNWSTDDDKFAPAGKSVLKAFNKSTALSAYGAAVGDLIDNGILGEISDTQSYIEKITLGGTADEVMGALANVLSEIKAEASKIGSAHRLYYHCLFKYMFVAIDDGEREFLKVISKAYNRFKVL